MSSGREKQGGEVSVLGFMAISSDYNHMELGSVFVSSPQRVYATV
jgi:hypothetical protein